MKRARAYLENDAGLALVSGLVILVLLTALGTYAINMAQIESTLAANLKMAKQAFYLAEAGLERGRAQLASTTALPPALPTSTHSLGPGQYTVSFPGLFPATPALEYTVTVQSVGTVGTASKTVRSVVTKTYEVADAAVVMRGNEAHVAFPDNKFHVDGRDHDHATGALTTLAPEPGLTVGSTTLEAAIASTLSSQQKAKIVGAGASAGVPSVEVSAALSSSTITSLANALCAAAPVAQRVSTPLNGTATFTGPTTFGTRASPQIYCLDGVGTPGNMEVELKGTFSGAGVLIVRNADVVAHSDFHYEGLIIVTGAKVGFGIKGGGDVYGAVLINETSADGSSHKELLLQGDAAVKRSQSALALARSLFPASSMIGLIAGLPSTVAQRSWVEVYN